MKPVRALSCALVVLAAAVAAVGADRPRFEVSGGWAASMLAYKRAYLAWRAGGGGESIPAGKFWLDPAYKAGKAWPASFPAEDAALRAFVSRRHRQEMLPWYRDEGAAAIERRMLTRAAKGMLDELTGDDPARAPLARIAKAPPAGADEAASRRRLGLFAAMARYRNVTARLADAAMLLELGGACRNAPRADAVADELADGTATAQVRQAVAALKARRVALREAIASAGPAAPARDGADPAALLTAAGRRLAALRLRAEGVERILFTQRTAMNTGHWYESFGTWCDRPNSWMHHKRSRLVILELADGTERELLADRDAGIRDASLDFDARRIVFAHRPAGELHNHLYEMRIDPSTGRRASGTSMRQLTDGNDDDIEPVYLPDGDIVFCSSRCRRWVPCLNAPVATLHRCGPDGEGIRPLTANVETENTPWVMPDGRVLFMRWEYVERDRGWPHGLWTINPDGTAIMTFWGNMNEGRVFIDAKSIPGMDEVIFIAHPHGSGDHVGTVGILTPNAGPDEHESIRWLTPQTGLDRKSGYRDPFPVAPGVYLVCQQNRLYLMDDRGRRTLVHAVEPGRDGKTWIHEPWPVRPRPRPPVLADRTEPTRATGTLVLTDAHKGRNMDGVEVGDVDHLLVLEILPKPVHHDGHTENLSYNGNFFMERVLGNVPVEPDGSAHFEVPAGRCVFFVAMDANGHEVKRMQSFVTVQPGEQVGCVGCHENRTDVAPAYSDVLAARRPASRIEPIDGVPDIFHFPRDIQPILDRHCTRCHSQARRAGGVVLTGELGPWFNQAYVTLRTRGLVAAGFGGVGNKGNLPPRSCGAGASKLWRMLQGGHSDVKLSDREMRMVYYWIESWMQYSGTFAALNSDGNVRVPVEAKLLKRRCGSCHGTAKLDLFVYGIQGGPMAADQRESMGLRVNLTRPERSLLLRAPLAVSAGGLGICRKRKALGFHEGRRQPNWEIPPVEPAANVFATREDPDYRAILAGIRAWADTQRPVRVELPGFRPHAAWVRQMQRNGHLSGTFTHEGKPLEFYFAVDERYYRSFWHRPNGPLGGTAYE